MLSQKYGNHMNKVAWPKVILIFKVPLYVYKHCDWTFTSNAYCLNIFHLNINYTNTLFQINMKSWIACILEKDTCNSSKSFSTCPKSTQYLLGAYIVLYLI